MKDDEKKVKVEPIKIQQISEDKGIQVNLKKIPEILEEIESSEEINKVSEEYIADNGSGYDSAEDFRNK